MLYWTSCQILQFFQYLCDIIFSKFLFSHVQIFFLHLHDLLSIWILLTLLCILFIASKFLHFLLYVKIHNRMFFRLFLLYWLLVGMIFRIYLVFVNQTIFDYCWLLWLCTWFCLFLDLIRKFIYLFSHYWFRSRCKLWMYLIILNLYLLEVFSNVDFLLDYSFLKHGFVKLNYKSIWNL